MRKIILLFFSFLLFVSCRGKKIESSEQAFDYLKGVKNYISDIKITFKNDRNHESISLKQYSSSKDMYRLDLGDERSYIYKDDKIYVKDVKNKLGYFIEEKFDEIYKYCFLNEYMKLIYSMDEVKYFEEVSDESIIYGTKVNLPTNNLNVSYAILYLDGKKYIPIKLEIFDNMNKQRILIEYLNFDILDEIGIDVFNY